MRGMGNMNKMMKQMQKMQKDMTVTQEELFQTTFEGKSGGEMIVVKANGKKEILEVNIKKDVVDPEDIEMLQDLFITATNDVLKQIDDATEKRLGSFTKGLNVPGLF